MKRLIVMVLILLMFCGIASLSYADYDVADFAGAWHSNHIVYSPSGPLWQRAAATINPDGTFTEPYTLSNGSSGTLSGTLLVSPDGLVTFQGDTTGRQCRMDSGKTVIVCTSTGSDGSIDLSVATKDSTSYDVTDVAGAWHSNLILSSPSGPLWQRAAATINPDGTLIESYSLSNGSSGTLSGTLLVSPDGLITIQGDTTGTQCRLDSGKTVLVCTSTLADGSIRLSVATKDSTSYDVADFAGTWHSNHMVYSPSGPLWQRAAATINPDGTFTEPYTLSNGSSGTLSGTLLVSSDGLVTFQGDTTGRQCRMDSGKTVIVCSSTGSDGSIDLSVATKDSSPVRVALLVRDSTSLDADETNIQDFLNTSNISFDVVDALAIKNDTINLSDYSVLYMRTGSVPVVYNDPAVVSKLQGRIETGATLIIEYYGLYLGQYLSVGTATGASWGPVVTDAVYYVDRITDSILLANIPVWSPPTPPDRAEQLIAGLRSPGGYSYVDFQFTGDSQKVDYWQLWTTYGWCGQSTGSDYCVQHPGLCTCERTVQNLSPTAIESVNLGQGKIYKLGLGEAHLAPASQVIFGPIATLMRENLINATSQPLIDGIEFDQCISELCTSAITVTAHDPEGGNLTYEWEALNGGTITGSGASVEFDPPGPSAAPACASYQVKVTITSDASDLSASQTIDIYVKLAGDADGNSRVDVLDRLLVRNHFGETPGSPGWDPRADVNCDGRVDVLDRLTVRNQFGLTGCVCE